MNGQAAKNIRRLFAANPKENERTARVYRTLKWQYTRISWKNKGKFLELLELSIAK
jgi:hypothetical protein